jgi:hypothetical protein
VTDSSLEKILHSRPCARAVAVRLVAEVARREKKVARTHTHTKKKLDRFVGGNEADPVGTASPGVAKIANRT